MSEVFGSGPNPSLPAAGDLASSRTIRILMRAIGYAGIVGAIGVMAFYTAGAMQDRAVMQTSVDHLTELRGLAQPVKKHLAPEYVDKEGTLVADPPTDPAKLINPDTLVLAHYIDADVDTQLIDWEAFQKVLAEATGKEVVLQEYLNTADDVAAVKAGGIQIVALHAADAPYIVNNAGFVPFGVLGTEAGAHGNRLDIAVGANSNIRALGDIRGRKLTCTAPNSMTGYRAAIIVLAQQADLHPDVDYHINFSLGQKRSVLGVTDGEFAVAALSDDKVESMLKNGSIKTSDLRVIYQSEVIPRLTIGFVYNLDPALAVKVTTAALDFINEGGAPDENSGKPMRFFPVDYKKDFEFVRTVDDCFDPRFFKGAKPKPTP